MATYNLIEFRRLSMGIGIGIEDIEGVTCNVNIRPYEETDEKAVLKILKEPGGHYYTKNSVDFNDFNESYVYEDNEGILGFICMDIHEKISQIICYVAPSWRRRGIGSQLFEFGRHRLIDLDPNTVWVFFRNDKGDSASFYRNRGAKPWYSYHYMVCDKQLASERNIVSNGHELTQMVSYRFDRVVPYAPEFFEEYLDGRGRAFLEINKMIDSKPHDERDRRVAIQKWAQQNEKDIWLFFNDEKLVGSIVVYEGFFDELFVVPEWQGKGLGESIVLWAMEYCISKGWEPSLTVVTGNRPAISLYERTGFKITQTLEMNRLFSSKKEPDLRGPIGG